jgi:hypothetical protein
MQFSWLTRDLRVSDARAAIPAVARCEIALSRPHYQVFSGQDIEYDAHSPKGSVTLRVAGPIGKQILVTDVRGNAAADRADLLNLFREEALASGGLGQSPQHSWLLIAVRWVLQADGIDHHMRRVHKLQSLFQSMLTGIVPAITDDEERLPVVFCFSKMLNRLRHCIIKSGLTG